MQNELDKVRWLIVAAQNLNKFNSYTGNPCTFNNCDIKGVSEVANGTKQYPAVLRNGYPKDAKYSTPYFDFTALRKQFLGSNKLNVSVGVTFPEWVTLYPIHVIDLQYNEQPLRSGTKLDVTINFNSTIPGVSAAITASGNIPAQPEITAAAAPTIMIHYITICENTLELTSNGNGTPFVCSR